MLCAAGGILIVQSGPAGFLSCKEVFTSIHCTLSSVFPTIIPYAQHFPSFCDCWGYNLAFTDAGRTLASAAELDQLISERVSGELSFFDGTTLHGLTHLNKVVRKAIAEETEVYTKDSARFIHGAGVKA